MRVFRGLASVELDGEGTCLTLGFFDGVHIGHQKLLRRVVSIARERGLVPLAITFDPHPEAVLSKKGGPLLLTTLDEKLALMGQTGLQAAVVLPFDRALAAMDATTFVDTVLLRRLHAAFVVAGPETSFGKGGRGNAALLKSLAACRGFDVEVVQEVSVAGSEVSSTAVRKLVTEGDLRSATQLLGRPYRVAGTVVPGDGRGRDLGFPTANLPLPPGKALPPDGVYACVASVGESVSELSWDATRQLDGNVAVVYLGKRPTFGGKKRVIEAHIIDETEELYGQPLALHFVERLRGDMTFDGPEALVQQMVEDARQAFDIVASLYSA